VEDLTFKAE
jgi:hypothetical protein